MHLTGGKNERAGVKRGRGLGRADKYCSDYSLCVQFAEDGEGDDDERHEGDLVAGADQCREHHRVHRGPEHVPVHLLPAVLVSQVPLLWGVNNDPGDDSLNICE